MTNSSTDLLNQAHESVVDCLVTLLEAASDMVVRTDRDRQMQELQVLCAALRLLTHAARVLDRLRGGDPDAPV